MGQRDARYVQDAKALSAAADSPLRDLTASLIPVVKRRVFKALERSREDVEFELVTLASLYTIADALNRNRQL